MTKPDILLASVDSLRADSVYDSTPQTPFLDSLTAEGLVFDRMFSTGAWTAPAFVGMMTGEQPRSYAPDMSIRRYPETLAEALEDAGYRTIAALDANYWISNPQGFDRGFGEFENHVDADEFITNKHSEVNDTQNELAQRLPSVITKRFPGTVDAAWNKLNSNDVLFSALQRIDLITTCEKKGRGAPQLIDTFVDSFAKGEGPVFGWIHFMDVHHPYLPTRESFRDRIRYPQPLINYVNNASVRSGVSLGPHDTRFLRKIYDRKVSEMDCWLKQLVNSARDRSERDVVAIIVGDHGEEFKEHGRFNHANKPYNELLHIPLIIDGIETGQISRNTSLIDFKSAIEAIGRGEQTISDHFQTKMPTCRYIHHGDQITERTMRALNGHKRPAQSRTVINGDIKIHYDSELESVEAYDLNEDFYEQENIFDESTHEVPLHDVITQHTYEVQELKDQRLVRDIES